MIPMFRYMDSQPFQKNRMPVNPYQYPNMGSVPSYTMMDPAKSCMPPHDSGHNYCHYGYPMPPSCCNDGNFFPGYYNFRPPYLPVPPHQDMHCYGSYPPCPEPYYVQYVPPMHYNVEQPRYEFDKNVMRNHHCCGCPNSLCGQKQEEDRCVKIEEEKPDNQRKGSMVPFQLGNNQSPFVWIPPDYVGSEKGKEPSETGAMKQEKERHGLNSTKNLDPKFWHGWPLSDLSRLGSWFPDAVGMGTRSVQNNQPEDGKKEFPFPLIWMPTFGREERAGKDVQNKDAPTKYTEEPSNVGKLVPTNILQKNDATSEGPEVVKTINQSNIPETDVKHKIDDTNKKKERRCIAVETAKENEVRESSKDNVKGQKATSPKKSRLPPVCLRVDPLPKKKNGNGSSRLQSPSKLSDVKENTQLDSKINSAIAESNSEKIIKEVEVTHDSRDGNHGNKENISRNGEPLSSTTQSQGKVLDKLCKEGTEEQGEKDRTIDQAPTEKNVDEGSEVSSGDIVQEEGKNEKPNLSDDEAAVLIQAAYRGYEVRKGELLKKMRQLAEVRQQVMEVQNRVNALELAPPQDERERVFVGEMIMGLLLQLDTIQGLYPSVREFRKSLAKELVALQEKLDCMVINKPTEVVQEAAVEKHAEHFDTETYHEIKEEEQHKEHQKPTGDGNSELPEVNDENMKEHEAEQLVEVKESEVQNEDISELSSHDLSKHFEGEEAESKVEMEQNVELLTDAEQKVGEVLQADRQKEAVNHQTYSFGDTRPAEDSLQVDASMSVCDDQVGAQTGLTPQVLDKINISAAAENGQTEDQLAADVELPMREDTNPNNFEAAKLEQLEIRGEVSETEENARDLEVELSSDGTSNVKHPEGEEDCHVSCVGSEQNREYLGYTEHENENEGASDESAELPGEELNSNDDDPNIQNKLVTEGNKQQTMDELVPSSQLKDPARRACDESADLPEELSKSYHNQNVQNEIVNEENEQRTADEETKMAEDMLHEPLVIDPVLSSKLDNEPNEIHAADEATLDGPSIQMGEGSLPSSADPNKLDLGTEKEMDKKLVEENEKMREMVEKLMEAGKEQMAIISKLSGRVKDLEKRLARKKTQRRGCGLSMPRQHMLNGRIKA
ncbi:BAG family molecular chaperone regulator 6 [Cucurbita maxima]|uniref:BAG family molecular chaperone regulator 6 n=1 Tax=Cucurbita maxima TaxID=3661 RepID=A0A6J1KD70_CUCMA|nr:BAG family molecular chaperone regulator 6 [Cucurbita maxima]XP_023000272.1 BAG family molecular chaperone regulator 6 [Cucurbita maxima]